MPSNYDLKFIHKVLKETIETNDIKEGINYIDSYNKTIDNKGIVKTITTRINASNNNYIADKNINSLKIRKLTPKECWRLMGFDDEDFEKAKQSGNSDAQLYKQAGNSIVVNVLEAILKNLLLK